MIRPEAPMVEQHWLEARDPEWMFRALWDAGRLTERKARLFAVVCCRRLWPLLADERSRRAAEISERYADGLASQAELEAANMLASEHVMECNYGLPWVVAGVAFEASSVDQDVTFVAAETARARVWKPDLTEKESEDWHEAMYLAEMNQEAKLLRDIFGNPFRAAPSLEPSLLTRNAGAVVQLARAAYEERLLPEGLMDPTRLAVLADALEEAGCADAEILSHLRGPGPHVRGCHVIDAILGKE
jgi:hypothetical protein